MCWHFMERNGNGNMVRREKVFIFIIIWRWATATKGEGVIRLENGDYSLFSTDIYANTEKLSSLDHSRGSEAGVGFLGISFY